MRIYTDVVLQELPQFFLEWIEKNFEEEGEWSDDKNDHPTKHGIRQMVADLCGWKGNLRDMSKEDAAKCWALHSWYWPRYDLLAQQSLLIAKHIMDTSGPAGTNQATKHIQTMLNNMNDPVDNQGFRYGADLKVDGLMGYKTSVRMENFLEHRKVPGECLLAFAVNAFQLRHFSMTADRNIGKRDFTFGWWMERCFKDCPEIFDYYLKNKNGTVKRHTTVHV